MKPLTALRRFVAFNDSRLWSGCAVFPRLAVARPARIMEENTRHAQSKSLPILACCRADAQVVAVFPLVRRCSVRAKHLVWLNPSLLIEKLC